MNTFLTHLRQACQGKDCRHEDTLDKVLCKKYMQNFLTALACQATRGSYCTKQFPNVDSTFKHLIQHHHSATEKKILRIFLSGTLLSYMSKSSNTTIIPNSIGHLWLKITLHQYCRELSRFDKIARLLLRRNPTPRLPYLISVHSPRQIPQYTSRRKLITGLEICHCNKLDTSHSFLFFEIHSVSDPHFKPQDSVLVTWKMHPMRIKGEHDHPPAADALK